MDVTSYRIALVSLAAGAIACILAIFVLAFSGRETPPVLPTLAGAFAGALSMAIHQPRSTNGNGRPPSPSKEEQTPAK